MEPTSVTGTRMESPRSRRDESAYGDADYGDGRGGESFVDGGEARGDGAAAGIGKEQARGGGEVAVETLEEAEEGHDENELDGPVFAEAVFEGDGGGEAFAEEGLPRGDVADREDAERVEEGADSES